MHSHLFRDCVVFIFLYIKMTKRKSSINTDKMIKREIDYEKLILTLIKLFYKPIAT